MSWASTPGVRRGMQANKRRDTAPEMALRRAVHALGLRYRVDYPLPLPNVRRRADLAFTKHEVAVFLDGCFWHGCPDHHTVSKTNEGYWKAKVRRNRERDEETDRLLAAVGWASLRVWEHEDQVEAAQRVRAAVELRRGLR